MPPHLEIPFLSRTPKILDLLCGHVPGFIAFGSSLPGVDDHSAFCGYCHVLLLSFPHNAKEGCPMALICIRVPSDNPLRRIALCYGYCIPVS